MQVKMWTKYVISDFLGIVLKIKKNLVKLIVTITILYLAPNFQNIIISICNIKNIRELFYILFSN